MAMGVEARIVLYASNESRARCAARAAFDRIAALDEVMSDWRDDSELRRACREAACGGAVTISPDLCRVLVRAGEISAATGGAFDVTVGPLVALWREARRTGRMRDDAALREALARAGWRSVHVDAKARTLRLEQPGMQLDLGGIGKGFAADEALRVLRAEGYPRSMVGVGGDIAAGEAPPGRAAWEIATIGAPGSIALRRAGVSTSGDAEQSVEIAGVRYSHIVDPRRGLGVTGGAEVTIVAPDAATADALATAIAVDPGVAAVARRMQGVSVYLRPAAGGTASPRRRRSSASRVRFGSIHCCRETMVPSASMT
jgi:thiamine biosynthesis lipoprotein